MLRLSRWIALGYIAICALVLGASFFFGPLGYAPFPLVAAPERPPIVVTIWYGSEKKEWLEATRQAFLASGPQVGGRSIQIQLKSMGSRELAERLAMQAWRGETPPTVVSPSSALWLDALKAPVLRSGSEAPQSLVLSPLVVVGWEQRAQALWPQAPANFWNDLHDALANPGGWQALGGSTSWGLVKLGHSSPATTNSGTQALLLMAYAFFNKSSGLSSADVNNPALEQWLAPIEAGVPSFSDSTSALMDDLVRAGPAKYDFAVVYENLALQNMAAARQRQGQNLRIFYPPATILSEHPYALADGAWVLPEQRAAALEFRAFLISSAAQRLARQYGFRPVDANVSIAENTAENPFVTYAANGVQPALAQQVAPPAADVLNALVTLWERRFKH